MEPESRVLETHAPPCSRPPPQRGARPGPDCPRVAGAWCGAAPRALQAEPRYRPHGPHWSRSIASPWAPGAGLAAFRLRSLHLALASALQGGHGRARCPEHTRLRSRRTLSSKVSPVPCAKSRSFSARSSHFCVRAATPEIPQKARQAGRQTLVFLYVRVQREAGGQGGAARHSRAQPPRFPLSRHFVILRLAP